MKEEEKMMENKFAKDLEKKLRQKPKLKSAGNGQRYYRKQVRKLRRLVK
jgi:hypothetical protein